MKEELDKERKQMEVELERREVETASLRKEIELLETKKGSKDEIDKDDASPSVINEFQTDRLGNRSDKKSLCPKTKLIEKALARAD